MGRRICAASAAVQVLNKITVRKSGVEGSADNLAADTWSSGSVVSFGS